MTSDIARNVILEGIIVPFGCILTDIRFGENFILTIQFYPPISRTSRDLDSPPNLLNTGK